MSRRPLSLVSLVLGVALVAVGQPFFERLALHPVSIPRSTETFAEWNDYQYRQTSDRQVTVEGTVTSLSPNGGAFCSGPFAGGPGLVFSVRNGSGRKGTHLAFSAFGVGELEPQLHRLGVGARVRLVATEGPVEILKDGAVVQKVEPSGSFLSWSRQRVVVVRRLEPW